MINDLQLEVIKNYDLVSSFKNLIPPWNPNNDDYQAIGFVLDFNVIMKLKFSNTKSSFNPLDFYLVKDTDIDSISAFDNGQGPIIDDWDLEEGCRVVLKGNTEKFYNLFLLEDINFNQNLWKAILEGVYSGMIWVR